MCKIVIFGPTLDYMYKMFGIKEILLPDNTTVVVQPNIWHIWYLLSWICTTALSLSFTPPTKIRIKGSHVPALL